MKPNKSTLSSSSNVRLKSVKPFTKKDIPNLEAKIAQLDDENSALRIDNERLHRRVKLLESEISKHIPFSDKQLALIDDAAERILNDTRDTVKK